MSAFDNNQDYEIIKCLCELACYCFIYCCCPPEPQHNQSAVHKDQYIRFEEKKDPHAPVIKSEYDHNPAKTTSASERSAYPEGWKLNYTSEEKKVDVYDDTYYTQAQKEILAKLDTHSNNSTDIIGMRPSKMAEPNDDALSAYYQNLKAEQHMAYHYK